MHYLDLKDGKEKDAVYEDAFDSSKPESQKNRKNFDIRMTNDKFTYDPQTNTISVHPDKEDKKLEGEMIITWIQYPLAFLPDRSSRTVSLILGQPEGWLCDRSAYKRRQLYCHDQCQV